MAGRVRSAYCASAVKRDEKPPLVHLKNKTGHGKGIVDDRRLSARVMAAPDLWRDRDQSSSQI